MLKNIDHPTKLLAEVVLLIAREEAAERLPTFVVRSRLPTWQFPT